MIPVQGEVLILKDKSALAIYNENDARSLQYQITAAQSATKVL